MPKKCLRCGSTFGSDAEYCPHDGSLLPNEHELPDPLLGTLLLEQFRVDARIGEGGMGTVYRARQTTIGRDVAIKVLRPELAADEHAIVRFADEARLATSLDHPNLVRVFLSGRLPDGRLYIVMELLEGRSLAEELRTRGAPSLERAVLMIMKLCAGLSAVHEAGVVHRDIKPENVYLVERGSDSDFVKLVDFGIARILDRLGPTTQAGKVFGTATYISPEAASGEPADRRSDIYSLGVLTYQLFTGALPFESSSVASVLMKHVREPPPHPSTKGRGAEVPPEVADVVMQALSKEREARQQSLSEFLDALAEAVVTAGLLNDARKLLLGTVWGEELAAPGSYLAELLASSAPPSVYPALGDKQRVVVERDPEEEALLSSAPKPYGTTSFDVEQKPPRKTGSAVWLWGSLALIALVLVGFAASASFVEPIDEPAPAEVRRNVAETDPPAGNESEEHRLVEPEAPAEAIQVDDATAVAPSPSKAKRAESAKKKRHRSTPKAARPRSAPVVLEPDDGIDWTVPDFMRETDSAVGSSRRPVIIDTPPPVD